MRSLDILLLVGSYLVGAIPSGYMLTRARTGKDIREQGSGNTGATNVLRTQGKIWGLLTLIFDFGKAALAVNTCRYFGSVPWLAAAGGFIAVFGHCFPIYIGFRGGKGIAPGLGAFVFISPAAALGGLVVWLVEVATLRFVSLGSIVASLAFGALLFILHGSFGWYHWATCTFGLAVALLLVARHHRNIRNLLDKKEPTLWGEGSRRTAEDGGEGPDD